MLNLHITGWVSLEFGLLDFFRKLLMIYGGKGGSILYIPPVRYRHLDQGRYISRGSANDCVRSCGFRRDVRWPTYFCLELTSILRERRGKRRESYWNSMTETNHITQVYSTLGAIYMYHSHGR
ncbi:hypothetical protein, variant 4 [Blastomyces dermatitidis ATCC 18188]|uniref:Uncharacterized protein n=1 Tax=Ajellomyces dermatitidis (strain ATCC 18188 / CBS 674.68) TaxID=653446 RepID=A0A0J9HG96_AJEDA|nr:hypothetical protein BDDG_12564 [Blastomyces dermatitidis ATCC 18188]KMW68072.1 hypothetical protein, variant 1 [Blastomyces dermatitidis ATCC 18188]KMW68073.1 hypothetical protein, variant 2 [Blastomyces dermatitidis ATCC 18188]KMW68074.1 hypothetical protein, variant 3 [Blastomyces dermatitidis ATCC 18188]KMW68075.1 hypothetical protein, variant 4 [Blastomyces dermatitidis ATCC 18188]